ncbi:phage head-tail joining protein [Methylorubrum extorquens]|uniref:phage head-tail joining protein n=1 Tax=Methylorubrum extorquens TaxID=408 RepID=UPI001EE604A8|nr:hypothetical protein [Methylorubrum extorquens]MCG5247972.1 hypothetical protein [Methylorubrum extorquens]
MADTNEQDPAKLRRQLVRLDDAMGSGVLRVEQADGGGSTVYRDYGEMQRARRDLVGRINALEAKLSGSRRRRTNRISLIGTSGF